MKRTIRTVLWNDDERRARTPWRLLASSFVFVVFTLLFGIAAVAVAGAAGIDPTAFDEFTILAIGSLLSVPATAAALWVGARYVDRRVPSDYGLRIDREWWVDLGFGLVLGAGLQSGIALVGLLAGWYAVDGVFVADGSILAGVVLALVLFVSVGVVEELLARGWLLTNLAEGLRALGTRAAVGFAVVVSSGIFGVAHLANPGASVASAVVISLAGVLLALGYVLTGELGIPIGIHVTWNFFQGPVFGLGVSGLELPVAVVALDPVGPDWVTGGGFGPEAGLLGFLAVVAGIAATVLWVRRRKETVDVHESIVEPGLRHAAED
ncbi:Metal-dependent membrane protease, CAAX family [Halalkaliarchaeum sp. AArc-CO]|uniref:CPBP family intramembrane glutamic endopeptidase n=1 Tax=unclassified Halalkaliarchaeum TaxID=2678344 RepID=UPI00217DCD9F|nr:MULTISPECIES: type II CAAX endopeptidase family protein [unclassified Halalkaliarchaeum]MDR5674140.1 type II CAAX endopeptidase family protein [Halalkaliarchaeum sp. AArc-GB]UWG50861.1 Metal-dependent membrane protease, CAAX family [Halalkaliarchaeum sp. AArc-CO]